MSFPSDFRPDASDELPATSDPQTGSLQGMSSLWPVRRPPRILVVDDHPSIAGLMSQLLEQRGYDVVTAENAEQAMAEVRQAAPT